MNKNALPVILIVLAAIVLSDCQPRPTATPVAVPVPLAGCFLADTCNGSDVNSGKCCCKVSACPSPQGGYGVGCSVCSGYTALKNIKAYKDNEGNVWVGQDRNPYLFKAQKGHLYREVAVFDEESDSKQYGYEFPQELLGYSHTGSQEVNGFEARIEVNHPENLLYYVIIPKILEKKVLQQADASQTPNDVDLFIQAVAADTQQRFNDAQTAGADKPDLSGKGYAACTFPEDCLVGQQTCELSSKPNTFQQPGYCVPTPPQGNGPFRLSQIANYNATDSSQEGWVWYEQKYIGSSDNWDFYIEIPIGVTGYYPVIIQEANPDGILTQKTVWYRVAISTP